MLNLEPDPNKNNSDPIRKTPLLLKFFFFLFSKLLQYAAGFHSYLLFPPMGGGVGTWRYPPLNDVGDNTAPFNRFSF